jgi:hypothetical protein
MGSLVMHRFPSDLLRSTPADIPAARGCPAQPRETTSRGQHFSWRNGWSLKRGHYLDNSLHLGYETG